MQGGEWDSQGQTDMDEEMERERERLKLACEVCGVSGVLIANVGIEGDACLHSKL